LPRWMFRPRSPTRPPPVLHPVPMCRTLLGWVSQGLVGREINCGAGVLDGIAGDGTR
jgi:hypothetical protein